MKQLSRRAIYGTYSFYTVPEVAHSIGVLCHYLGRVALIHIKNCEITTMHGNIETCQTWHTRILIINNLLICYFKLIYMILSQYSFCNHHCEVCGTSNLNNDYQMWIGVLELFCFTEFGYLFFSARK